MLLRTFNRGAKECLPRGGYSPVMRLPYVPLRSAQVFESPATAIATTFEREASRLSPCLRVAHKRGWHAHAVNAACAGPSPLEPPRAALHRAQRHRPYPEGCDLADAWCSGKLVRRRSRLG